MISSILYWISNFSTPIIKIIKHKRLRTCWYCKLKLIILVLARFNIRADQTHWIWIILDGREANWTQCDTHAVYGTQSRLQAWESEDKKTELYHSNANCIFYLTEPEVSSVSLLSHSAPPFFLSFNLWFSLQWLGGV